MQNEKMRKFDLCVGCNVNGECKFDRNQVRSIVGQELRKMGFDGCTFTEAIGMWQGESELTVICTICTNREQAVYVVAGLIRDRLQQESVLVMESNPKIAFI